MKFLTCRHAQKESIDARKVVSFRAIDDMEKSDNSVGVLEFLYFINFGDMKIRLQSIAKTYRL